MAGVALLGAGIFATEGISLSSIARKRRHTLTLVSEHLPSLKRLGANLKAVYSRSKSTATKLLTAAEKLGFSLEVYSDETEGKTLDDLLKRSDITAVIILLPIPVQPDACRKAFAAGKHVLCEKPIAKDVQTAKDLIVEYQRDYLPKGLVFSVAEQFRYLEVLELARKWVVDDKLLGDLTQIHFRMWRNMQPGGKYFETPWRKVPEYQGGFILDGGVHHIAMLRYVSGQDIVETQGYAHQLSEYLPPCDTVNAAVLYSGGAVGTFSMSFASTKDGGEVNFIGSKGTLLVSTRESKLTLLDTNQNVVKDVVVESNGVDNELKAFLKAVEVGKNEDRAGAIEALNDVAVVESLVSGGGKVKNWQS